MSPAPLPVEEILDDLVLALRDPGAAVLVAPPGAGKTTRVPPALLAAGLAQGPGGENRRIIVLQPRRVAARLAARRIADEQGWRLGEEVGWHIRFERRTGPRTRIELLTEGMLTRRLQDDPFLDDVGVVVLDELHERSLHADLALGMLVEARAAGRDDLKILAMSATLDPGPVAALLGGAPTIRSEGRLHPVDVRYQATTSDAPVHVRCARAVRHLLTELPTGHLLVFLPGVAEIDRTAKALAGVEADGVQLLPLHGRLPPEAQERALAPSARRKVVLATNVAETSVTLDGVVAVVDSGLVRQARFDPAIGLQRLETRDVAQDSADQRAGRAGRTGPGVCERLWTEGQHRGRPPRTPPEIRRADLSGPLLDLKAWGADPAAFPWLDPPSPAALAEAEATLREIGAVDDAGGLTPDGRVLARLPAAPRVARLIVAGHHAGVADRVCALGARIAGDRDDDRAARQLSRVAQRLLGPASTASGPESHDETVLRALLTGFPDRIGRRRNVGSSRIRLADGRGALLDEALDEGPLRGAEFVFALTIQGSRRGERTEHRVRAALPIDPTWLPTREEEVVEWDAERQTVVGRSRWLYRGLVLNDRPADGGPDPAMAAELLATQASADPTAALQPSDAALATIARLRWADAHASGIGLADAADLTAAARALAAGRRSFAELRKPDLNAWLLSRLSWKQRKLLDELAPTAIAVPGGRRPGPRRLQYQEDGPPILASRIQDFFGLTDTPRVARGAVPVLLHLLAPNGRPAQVTQDLASFWASGYAAVRRELRGRYPKHDWPDDPR